jgi:hypothetical protein
MIPLTLGGVKMPSDCNVLIFSRQASRSCGVIPQASSVPGFGGVQRITLVTKKGALDESLPTVTLDRGSSSVISDKADEK